VDKERSPGRSEDELDLKESIEFRICKRKFKSQEMSQEEKKYE
jgi:hypothetical protein